MNSIGLIEIVGLAGAFEAIDTAAKAANITVLGYELTNGGGYVTVKISGEISAVKAAVDAACMAAEKITTIISKHVIPRPSEELGKFFKEELSLEEQNVESNIISEEIKINEILETEITTDNIVPTLIEESEEVQIIEKSTTEEILEKKDKKKIKK